MIDTKELRRLAQEATPGPWESHVGHLVLAPFEGGAASIAEMMLPYRIGYNDGEIVSDRKSNAAFIAAANPAVVSELLDRLDAAEKHAAELEERCAVLTDELRLAVRQNSRDRLMTAEELRSCEATLGETK